MRRCCGRDARAAIPHRLHTPATDTWRSNSSSRPRSSCRATRSPASARSSTQRSCCTRRASAGAGAPWSRVMRASRRGGSCAGGWGTGARRAAGPRGCSSSRGEEGLSSRSACRDLVIVKRRGAADSFPGQRYHSTARSQSTPPPSHATNRPATSKCSRTAASSAASSS